MKFDKLDFETTFDYVSPKLSGLLGEIVEYLESNYFYVVKATGGDKFKYRIMHPEIGCVGSLKSTTGAVILLDRKCEEHVVDNINEFRVAFADVYGQPALSEFIVIASDAFTVAMEQSNDHVKSLVQLIMYLILQRGLSMSVSKVISYEQLLRIVNYNNTKSFIIFKDRIVDHNGSEIRNELDVLLYL